MSTAIVLTPGLRWTTYDMDGNPAHHDCHTTDQQASINTDCAHPMRTTDPACTGCALRSDQ